MPNNKKPSKIKKLQGTYRPHRENENEVEFSPVKNLPAVPDTWPDEQRDVFLDVCSELKKFDLLFRTDLASLEEYSYAIYQAREARRNLGKYGFTETLTNKGGHSYEVVSPWLKVLSDANSKIQHYAAKFGFNPVDKTKIAIGTSKKKKDDDPFEEI